MSLEKIHIIAFDVPYPPNYGGIVDVYYKLKSLHAVGAKIIYHCFFYKGHNPPTEELEKYAEKVYYYPRSKKIHQLFLSGLPYVVSSRNNKEVLENLLEDNHPILFDGIQTCYFLNHPQIKQRIRLFRANNIEHKYYFGLAKWETSKFKKIYLKLEGRRLQKFEKELKGVNGILSVAKMDIEHFAQYAKTYHIPPFFHSENKQSILKNDTERHVLFQGNLSVKENEHAALFIIEKVASLSDNTFVIAGKNPSQDLSRKAKMQSNVILIDTPSIEKMEDLIRRASVNLLLTFQQTGIKLKVLHALESGQHIIINNEMDDSGIFASMCHVENEPKQIARKVDELIDIPFTQIDKNKRDMQFATYYNNLNNARKILEIFRDSLTQM